MSLDFSQDYEAPIVTTSLIPQDDGEVSLRPKTLAEYTGQEKAKENLSVYIEAARRRNEPLDHVLLHGPPGLGKTTLAGIVASEMGQNIRVTSGPAIERAGDLAERGVGAAVFVGAAVEQKNLHDAFLPMFFSIIHPCKSGRKRRRATNVLRI